MSAQEWQEGQEALLRVTIKDVRPGGVTVQIEGTSPGPAFAYLREPAADLLPVPEPDADVIERAARVLGEHMWSASDDELCSCGWAPDAYWQQADALDNAEEGDEPDVWAPIVQAFVEHQAANLLAVPVREPGRSEAEPPPCPNRREVQHRDRKPPWCDECGWNHGRSAVPAAQVSDTEGSGM